MAQALRDPSYVFPTGDAPDNTAGTTSQSYAVSETPTTRSVDYAASRERRTSGPPQADNLIGVMTDEGEELYYPVVHGRAGGSIHPSQHSTGMPAGAAEASGTVPGNRGTVAARALRHASIASIASASSHNAIVGCAGPGGDIENEETPEEVRDAYQQSRATPTSIRRHRFSTPRSSRSPPPALALRGERVADTVRAVAAGALSSSRCPSNSSSLVATPRQYSQQRTSDFTTPTEFGGLDGVPAALGNSTDRRPVATVDGAEVRVEETGVSTLEMAEYFAENAVETHRRTSTSPDAFLMRHSASAMPTRHAFVTPRHSQLVDSASVPPAHRSASSNAAAANAASVAETSASAGQNTQRVLEHLVSLIEEQSLVSQQLLQRIDTLESTNKSLGQRLHKLEARVQAGESAEEAVARVSAHSGSPSVTRTSGSLESATRPSTRAPSKAVN